jgi:NADH dehydrogenase I D subunit
MAKTDVLKQEIFREYGLEAEHDLDTDYMVVNMGPSHPTMHGTLRAVIKLDGETIVDSALEIGYLHRCFAKESERGTYTHVVPYTDRLNYVSALMNNVGFTKAVEKLMEVDIPDRAKIIRVIICELSRVMDHFVCIGANLVDIGALTNFWYFFYAREKIYEFVEKLTGARLTNSFTRIGGLAHDLYEGFEDDLKNILKESHQAIRDVEGLVRKNRIFVDRTVGVGAISAEDAIDYGYTGPCLRGSGVSYDVRKAHPYYHYDEFDFEVPLGRNGDSFDRIVVRFEEMRQSLRIVEQTLQKLPPGPVMSDDPRVALPEKNQVYNSIEGLMNHFMIIMFGVKPRRGEVYDMTEAANGELGFYVVSDGGTHPYRVRVRPPCFPLFASYPFLIEGQLLADAIATIGNLNIIAGELDR